MAIPPGNRQEPAPASPCSPKSLCQDDVENVVAAVVDAARKGDMAAAKIILDRIAPARRDRPVSFDLPKIERPADAVAASAAILDAVSEGALTPGEAAEISKLIEGVVKTLRKFEHHQGISDDLFTRLAGFFK